MAPADIGQSSIHFKWSKKIPPVLTVRSGAELTFSMLDGLNNQITPANACSIGAKVDFSQADPAFGPVAVEGAEPGDTLRIDILELTPATYGWTCILPGFGLLQDEFPDPHVEIWDLSEIATKRHVVFRPGIQVPVNPFLGVMGVAPPDDQDYSTIPPHHFGGNIDCKHVTVGASLFLPVQAPGALFSCGDGHVAQGDGEVCGTAIETPMTARLRLTVEKGKPWVKSPNYVTRPQLADTEARGQEYAVVGIDADLHEATRKAVRGAIEWLVAEKSLTRVEAYMLCSIVGDLKILEAVDMPHYAVAMAVPLNIFVDQ
ncbi:hypothetical protein AYO22_02589 [Fonsecaea multimorphosa]|nr:hypothetical protein AYO22_02589 [Fonsecaea multimorphosa]